jgi:hypothetical protein
MRRYRRWYCTKQARRGLCFRVRIAGGQRLPALRGADEYGSISRKSWECHVRKSDAQIRCGAEELIGHARQGHSRRVLSFLVHKTQNPPASSSPGGGFQERFELLSLLALQSPHAHARRHSTVFPSGIPLNRVNDVCEESKRDDRSFAFDVQPRNNPFQMNCFSVLPG